MKPRQIARLARTVGAAPDGMTRRRFVELTLGAGAGLMLPAAAFAQSGRSKPRVVVVGAGFAGLSCAWQLRRAGVAVTVLEARDRVGGRVLTLDDFVDDALVEAGAEFIGSNHPTWMQYAKHFGLRMREVTEDEENEAPIFLNGRRVPTGELGALWESVSSTLTLMNDDARKVDLRAPWNGEGAEKLDHTSMSEAAARWEVSDQIRAATMSLLANDNAMFPDRASYLAILCAIAGGGFERYWTESEVFRCENGSQSLAFKLADEIGSEFIRLDCALADVRLRADGVVVKDAKGEKHEADYVVMTVPPPAWRHFQTDPPIPSGYAPHAGPAIKYLAEVSSAFWQEDGLASDSLTDSAVGMTWEGTDGQRKTRNETACLVAFSGGRAAEECLAFAPAKRQEEFVRRIGKIYPGFADAFEKGLFFAWPNEKWTMCGYSSPSPGQVTTVYPNFEKPHGGRMYFAGEHTSISFRGFMEGALQSGALVAGKIAKSLNLG